MKISIKNSLLIAFASIAIYSCTKKQDVGNTSTVAMSGEWFIEYFDSTDASTPLDHHSKILTYNTSANDGKQLWLDDPNFWPFKAKMDIDVANLKFKPSNTIDILVQAPKPPNNLRVITGKVLPKMGKSKSGNVVDSIYLKVEFLDDDPGVIYEIRGHARTGFFEDEY
jgi:hypothetical protein